MALRQILAAFILAIIIGKTLRDPKFGVLAFVAILFLDPASLFWGFDEWRIPLVTSITILVATLIHAHERNKDLNGGAIFFWVVALTFFLTISTMHSVNVERSSRILVDYWIKTFLFCWLLMLWTKNENDLRLFFTVLVSSFVFLTLRGIYRYSVGYTEIGGLAGIMQDRNDFALHVMMVVPIAYAMAETAKNRWIKLGFLASTILMFICVILTFSRMGFLLILSAALMLFWSSRNKIIMLLITVPIVTAFLFAVPETYFERIESIKTYEQDPSATGRIEAWIAGIEMGKDHLFTGVGLKCFELPEVYFKYATGVMRVSHNAYVQLFSEAGLPALLAWFSLMMVGLYGARTLAAHQEIPQEMQRYARAILRAILLYLIGSIFLNSAYFELPYLILASFVALRRMNLQTTHSSGELKMMEAMESSAGARRIRPPVSHRVPTRPSDTIVGDAGVSWKEHQ